MAYATIADMQARFGAEEMIRLSAADGGLAGVADTARIQTALDDVTAVIESYLRQRYLVPLTTVPAEIRAACCALARYDLAQGEQKTPSEQMIRARDEAIAWLRRIAEGSVRIDAPVAAASGSGGTGARSRDRCRDFPAVGW